MKPKGSKIKTIKENKYLHKCIINLWNQFPQEFSEAKSLVGFRKGLDIYTDNGNICSCSGWCGKYKGIEGPQLLLEPVTGRWSVETPG